MKTLNNRVYNFLKYFITIFLPGVGAVYFGSIEVLDFEAQPGVNGTINVAIAILGVVLGISSRQYNKHKNEAVHESYDGDLIIGEVDGEKYLGLGVNESIEAMQAKTEVRLQVVDRSVPEE